MKTKATDKKNRALVETFFNKHGKGIIFPITALGKIMNAGLKECVNGETAVENAVIEAINVYRVHQL